MDNQLQSIVFLDLNFVEILFSLQIIICEWTERVIIIWVILDMPYGIIWELF